MYTVGGTEILLDVERFAGPPDEADGEVLDRCVGPTLDIGCGPGRMAAELGYRGVPALGVDIVPAALLLSRVAGAAVLCRSVFDRLPGEGRWHHALLIDGNVGIGGDPRALLARCRDLLAPAGATLIVEVECEETDERHEVSLDPDAPMLMWALVGAAAVCAIAEPLGFGTQSIWSRNGRRFVELVTRESF
jgi:SAM-dependent methyltransferase